MEAQLAVADIDMIGGQIQASPSPFADGGKVRETVKVMPEQVRLALDQQRQDYLASLKQRSLHDRADAATRGALGRAQDDQPRRQGLAHDDIPF